MAVLSNVYLFFCKLSPTDESLYSLPGSTVLTAISFVISTAMISTAMSSASMYSQDSWKTASPSISVSVVDPRQTVIATSPAAEWFDIAEEVSDEGFTSKSPSTPPPQDVSFSMVKEINDTLPHSKSDFVPSLANNAVRESIRSHDVDVGSSRPLGKRLTKIIIKSQSTKKIDQHGLLHSPKHSKSSKTFRKVMNRLSFLPASKKN
jgi:hypothetical protein